MPCISDPGYELVNEALKEGIKVVTVPGPSSILSAASISGYSMRRIAYEGFLPKKKGRQTLFLSLQEEKRPIIILESPNRLLKTLKDIYSYLGNRHIVIARELTKVYEQVIRGEVLDLIDKVEKKPLKGEMVLIIKGLCDKDE